VFRVLVILILTLNYIYSNEIKADLVIIKKSKRKLYLYSNGQIIREFNISLGGNPKGKKVQEGDKKTPEGLYYLDYKNPKSRFYKSIHISYPNSEDIARAKSLGVNAGGDIMIHGEVKARGDSMIFFKTVGNWTAGCIALKNRDMDEVWRLIDIPTKIKIEP
jgi:murein L,D-transpeptidase YafK